jgi:pimeloyl-ACP methyl ester carboxylesterase
MNCSAKGATAASTSDQPFVLREGSGEPLVLLHGVTGSATMWQRVVPLLASRYDVIVPTALGHRGGAPVRQRPTSIAHVIDDAECLLDRLGLRRVHLAGNSMGGWVALELARRERALSVCAISPAGAWTKDRRAQRILSDTSLITRLARPVLPMLAYFSQFRRYALRAIAAHGDRVTRDEMIELVDDMIGCTATADLLATREALTELKTRCPITLAWCEKDRIFPVRLHAHLARQLVPGARYIVIPGVGHVPMLDDPKLVAETIVSSIATSPAAG